MTNSLLGVAASYRAKRSSATEACSSQSEAQIDYPAAAHVFAVRPAVVENVAVVAAGLSAQARGKASSQASRWRDAPCPRSCL